MTTLPPSAYQHLSMRIFRIEGNMILKYKKKIYVTWLVGNFKIFYVHD